MTQRLISRADLCSTIKISDSSLRKYISRRKIIETRKGYIDLDDEDNKVCIITYAAKKGVDAEAALYQEKPLPESKIEIKLEDSEEKSHLKGKKTRTYSKLQTMKIEKEVEKLGVETNLKNLELEKKKAKVLPLDFVIEWSALNIRGIFGETVNFGNSIIESICNDMDADTKTKLEYKKKFKQGFNEILKEGIKNQKPEAIAQAKEYALMTKW